MNNLLQVASNDALHLPSMIELIADLAEQDDASHTGKVLERILYPIFARNRSTLKEHRDTLIAASCGKVRCGNRMFPSAHVAALELAEGMVSALRLACCDLETDFTVDDALATISGGPPPDVGIVSGEKWPLCRAAILSLWQERLGSHDMVETLAVEVELERVKLFGLEPNGAPDEITALKCRFYHPVGTPVPEYFKQNGQPCGPLIGNETKLAFAVTGEKGGPKLRTAAKDGLVFVHQIKDRLFQMYCRPTEIHNAKERFESYDPNC